MASAKEGGGYGKLAQLYEAALMANPDEFLHNPSSKTMRTDLSLGNLAKILLAERSVEQCASHHHD